MPSLEKGRKMKIWLPNFLYQAFPMVSILVGFSMVALVHHPLGIVTAGLLYAYSFRVLWMRTHARDQGR